MTDFTMYITPGLEPSPCTLQWVEITGGLCLSAYKMDMYLWVKMTSCYLGGHYFIIKNAEMPQPSLACVCVGVIIICKKGHVQIKQMHAIV